MKKTKTMKKIQVEQYLDFEAEINKHAKAKKTNQSLSPTERRNREEEKFSSRDRTKEKQIAKVSSKKPNSGRTHPSEESIRI
jgi:hypothetical protein